MKYFCESYNLSSLTKNPTWYKNLDNPRCIGLKLTNKHRNFQNSYVIEMSGSDFDKMTATASRTQFPKLKLRILFYRNYTKSSNVTFIIIFMWMTT